MHPVQRHACIQELRSSDVKRFSILAGTFLLLSASLMAQVTVATQHNDNSRTGQNMAETILTPSNVKVSTFGRLFSRSLDGYVYAQPLYIPNVVLPGLGTHNVVYVATEHDTVYAWDADTNTGSNSAPLWKVSFINPAQKITAVPSSSTGCADLIPEIGITSTPAIDTATGTLYVLAKTKENGSYYQRLHALDITTGAEKFGGPVIISASVPGTGDGSSNGVVTFDPLREAQRPGLLLQNGTVYIGWASHCDIGPYHGWVMGYDSQSLAQVGVWNSSPNGGLDGVWMGGAGLAADSSANLFISTGNGTFDANTSGGLDYGDSIVKLALRSGQFTVPDFFTPWDQNSFNNTDADVGSGGVLLLPDQPDGSLYPHLLAEIGKTNEVYLLNRDNMGKFNAANNSQIVQDLTGVVGGHWGMPAFWNNTFYFGGQYDNLKAIPFNTATAQLASTPSSQSSTYFMYPGPTPSISANGNTNGIVWAIQSDAYATSGSSILHAYAAANLVNELYNSNQSANDNPGGAVKFTVPTIANGKVYVGAVKKLTVYGLLPSSTQYSLTIAPPSVTVTAGSTATYTVTVAALAGHTFNGTVTLSISGLPTGATATFNPIMLTGPGSSTLTVTTSGTVSQGTTTFTVTAKTSNPTVVRKVTAKLVVGTAGAISINWVGNGVALKPTDVAGVVLKGNWNNLLGAGGANALVDESGSGTSATATFAGNNGWALPISATTANAVMMQGYLDDANGGVSTVTVSNIPSSVNGFNVYAYADGDNGGATRSANYTISGPSFPTATLTYSDNANSNFSGTFTQVTTTRAAGNYMVFSGISGTSFTLTATPTTSSDGTLRAPMNGIQLIPQ